MVCDTVFNKNPLLLDTTLIFYSQYLFQTGFFYLIFPLFIPYLLIDLILMVSLAVVSMLLSKAGTTTLSKSVLWLLLLRQIFAWQNFLRW